MHELCVAGANLSVGRRAPQLITLLLVVGLSLTLGLVELVTVVPRDAHGLAPAGKREHKELCLLI